MREGLSPSLREVLVLNLAEGQLAAPYAEIFLAKAERVLRPQSGSPLCSEKRTEQGQP